MPSQNKRSQEEEESTVVGDSRSFLGLFDQVSEEKTQLLSHDFASSVRDSQNNAPRVPSPFPSVAAVPRISADDDEDEATIMAAAKHVLPPARDALKETRVQPMQTQLEAAMRVRPALQSHSEIQHFDPRVLQSVAPVSMSAAMSTPMEMSRDELFAQHDASQKAKKATKSPRVYSRVQRAIMSVVLYGTVVVVGFAVILAAHGDLSIFDIEYYATTGMHGAEVSLHLAKAPPSEPADLPWTPIPENMPRWSPEEPAPPPPPPTFTEPTALSAMTVAPVATPAPKATAKKSKSKKHAS